MRAWVTGATGFLGAHVVRHLIAVGDEVAVLIRPRADPWRLHEMLPHITIVSGDMEGVRDLRDTLAAWRPEVVYHLAWSGVHGALREEAASLRLNVSATLDLVGVAADAGCRSWVGIGSQAEYGPSAMPLTDDMCARPVTPYGAGKLAAGQLTAHLCASRGLTHSWLRLLSSYGPMDEPTYLIPHVVGALLADRTPSLTDGSQLHDTLHASDVASALRAAGSSTHGVGTCLLSSGEARSVRSIVEMIRNLAAPAVELTFGGLGSARTGLSGQPERLTSATGWVPRISLEDGLRETIAWYRGRAQSPTAHR